MVGAVALLKVVEPSTFCAVAFACSRYVSHPHLYRIDWNLTEVVGVVGVVRVEGVV